MKFAIRRTSIKLIPLALAVVIVLSVITDYKAQMFVIGNADGKQTDEPNEPDRTYATGTNNVPDTNNATGTNYATGTNNVPGTNYATGTNNMTGTNNATGTNYAAGTNNVPGQSQLRRDTNINPLTGLGTAYDISSNRPVAVSVSNQKAALPTNATNGISQADIVYEVLVEGGITRFIALFQDFSNVGVVGSIRSARHYTVELAEAYDAMFIHAGGSPLGFEEIEKRNITNFDEVSGRRAQIFKRDVNRIPGQTVKNYHSVTTSGASFSQWFPTYGLRSLHSDGFRQALNFTDNPIPAGAKAHEVGIRFSATKDSIFIYENTQNVYYMAQFGSFFTDANNDAPVTFTNLLILEMPISDLVGHGEGAGRQDMSTVGQGPGVLISNGRYVRINWYRSDKSAQFIYTYENGSEIELGRGKTYIGIIPVNAGISIS